MKKIFIGGFGGCGSRVVQYILKQHYFIGNNDQLNEVYDFGAGTEKYKFVKYFDELFFKNNEEPLKNYLLERLKDRNSFSIKHGHLMFIVKKLKKWFPDSHFLFSMRNVVDNMMNDYATHHKYGGLPLKASIYDKVNYALKEINTVLMDTDHVVSLEDLCFNKKETLEKLFDFVEVDDKWENYKDFIIIPKTMGRGRDIYDKINNPLYKKLGFQ